MGSAEDYKNIHKGAFLPVPWLRFRLPMQGVCMQSLIRELRSHKPQGQKAKHKAEAILSQIQKRLEESSASKKKKKKERKTSSHIRLVISTKPFLLPLVQLCDIPAQALGKLSRHFLPWGCVGKTKNGCVRSKSWVGGMIHV